MVTKHFFKGVVAFMSLIILGLIIFSIINKNGNGVTAEIDIKNKAEVVK